MTDKSIPHVLIAAGGTGGHMFPAQALSEGMLKRGWRVSLSTDDRGQKFAQGFPRSVHMHKLTSATFRQGSIMSKLLTPFKILRGVLAAVFLIARDRPDVVVGFGGYPTIPAVAAAWLTRTPVILHEQNGVLGRVNRLFCRRVNAVACGTWPTVLPFGVDAVYTGNPVRQSVLDRKAAPYTPPGDWPMNILVFGGSQGAQILSDIVPKAVAMLPQDMRQYVRITQQARKEDIGRVQSSYDLLGIRYEVKPFFGNLSDRISEAQLVICRAGASTLAELTVIGRPSILIPYSHAASDHQTVNSRSLVDAEAAVAIPESLLTPQSLAEMIITILGNPDGANQMAVSALSVGAPDAIERLMKLVEQTAAKVPN